MPATSSASKRPRFLTFRSSKWFISSTAFIAVFTDSFLYGAIVPVLPFSLVDRSGVSQENVQFWLSTLLVVFGLTVVMGSPLSGWAASRDVPRKTQFLFGLGMAFISTILFCFGQAPWMMVTARAAQGFSASTVYLISLVLVADSMPPSEIGSWTGMVISGMNLGLLTGPPLGGFIYDKAGYYAVFETILVIIAFDFFLRLTMIEKQSAMYWARLEDPEPSSEEPIGKYKSREEDHFSSGRIIATGQENQERAPLLRRTSERPTSWVISTFPTMHILLYSPRVLAAIGGSFTQTMLVTAFDPILPLFVHRTFGWGPTGSGLMFLSIGVPSLLGGLTGILADVYGPKLISLVGFAITIPSLAALSAVTHKSTLMEVLLCVLLTLSGIGLSFVLAPLTSDLYGEVTLLAQQNPDILDVRVAFAQAYAMYNAMMGLACAVGPALAGFLYKTMGWQVTVAFLALLCALGGLLVFKFTGSNPETQEEGTGTGT